MFTLRHILFLTLAVALAAPLVSAAQRPRPPNLKMGQGIDMRDGPLLNVSRIDVESISLNGAAPGSTWASILASTLTSTLAPYSTTIADATSDLASMTEAAGYTPASAFLYSTANSKVTITGYVGTAVNVRIPPYIGGFPVVSIGGAGARASVAVKSLILPPTLRNIAASALSGNGFSCAVSLPSIIIPAAVTNIGVAQFSPGAAVFFEGPAPTVGTPLSTGAPNASVYYLAGYRYPAKLGACTTYLYGPAQTANSLILSGTNLYFISSTGITNLVTVTPVP